MQPPCPVRAVVNGMYGMYGHAERARVAAERAIAETVELLLSLHRLDQDQLRFIEEFAPEQLRHQAS